MTLVRECRLELVDHRPPLFLIWSHLIIPNIRQNLAGNQYCSHDDVIIAVDDFYDKQDEISFTNENETL